MENSQTAKALAKMSEEADRLRGLGNQLRETAGMLRQKADDIYRDGTGYLEQARRLQCQVDVHMIDQFNEDENGADK